MESPVVVDKPPEYHGRPANDRGFPFDEEEGSGAWSELASRHPDIAARLRQRPATWARKRRPNSQDPEDFGDGFGGFDRFPFDDIPPEFREHFPTHWNRRQREQQPQSPPQPQQTSPQPQPQQTSPQPQPQPQPKQQTTATQTDDNPPEETQIPQYGLRNTVDLGQKSPTDPSLVDAEDRSQRSMSAPPDTNVNMSAPNHDQPRAEHPSNVRVIPIVVEGRDQPVINKNVDHGTHFAEAKPAYVPPPQPHIDREQYFADEGPAGYVPPPNFSRSFGSPYGKFRQGPQPFVHQKVYPQSATTFARGTSPQRSQSPKPQDEHYVKVPVHHDTAAPRPEQRQQARPAPQQHQPPPQQQHQPPPQQQQAPPQQQQQDPPQPKPQPPSANDPITQILAIQTDVLNLMGDVENFKGNKKDKYYLFLDEMLTRNLIKLDNIETDGKENIRQARREAIKCIQKCIAVLEAKASGENKATAAPQETTQEVEMKEDEKTTEGANENGEVKMKEPKETKQSETEPEKPQDNKEPPTIVEPVAQSTETKDTPQVDTRPVANAETEKKSPKKGKGKKRDKSKDKKEEKVETEAMQVDDKGDKQETMEVESTSQ